jgi:hypothetical protein
MDGCSIYATVIELVLVVMVMGRPGQKVRKLQESEEQKNRRTEEQKNRRIEE